jgi:hypothetical protein
MDALKATKKLGGTLIEAKSLRELFEDDSAR